MSAVDRLLLRLGLQPRPLRGLVAAFLRLDLRGLHYGAATGAKASEVIPPLYWVIGQMLAASALLTTILFMRVEAGVFAAVGLTAALLLVLSAVLVEFHEAALDPRDPEVLGHRPITGRTYAAARSLNLAVYVGLMGLALTVFPLVMGAVQRDAGPLWVPAYLLASALAAAAGAALGVLVHGAVGEGAKQLLAWVQIALVLVGFYGGQLLLRKGAGSIELLAARPPGWAEAVPTVWLGRAVAELSQGLAPGPLARLGLAALGTLALLALALGLLAIGWRGVARARGQASPAVAPPARPGTLASGLAALLCGGRTPGAGRIRAAAFALAWAHLARDPALALRTWPHLTLGATALALALFTGQCGDPLAGQPAVLPAAALALFAGAAPAVLHALRAGRDPEAAWLLRAAPLRDPGALVEGVRRAALARVFVPALLLAGLVVAWAWRDALHALAWTAVALLLVDLASRVSAPEALGGLPFAGTAAKGGGSSPLPVVSAAVLAGAALLASGWTALAGSWPGRIGGAVGLVAAWTLLSRWSRSRVRRAVEAAARG